MSSQGRHFAMMCKSCGRVVFTVAQLADPETTILVEHLAQCVPRFAALGAMLQHVRVAQAAE